MRKLNLKRTREHWAAKDMPQVTVSGKHANFMNVKWVEDVQTPQGVMHLAVLRVLDSNDLLVAGHDGADLGIAVGHSNHNEVLEVNEKFYMYGVDVRNVPFYKEIDGMRCHALYEVEVTNGEVVHAVTVELFKTLGVV